MSSSKRDSIEIAALIVALLAIPAIAGFAAVTIPWPWETNDKPNKTLSYSATDYNGNTMQEEIPLKPLKKLKEGQKYHIKYHMPIYEVTMGPTNKPIRLLYTVDTEKVVTVHDANKK
jgi:hypothetical protein